MIYILSTYEEHGAEDIQATCDPKYLFEMLETYCSPADDYRRADVLSYEKQKLKDLINDLRPGNHDLSKYWGGVQLHIVDPWENKKE